MEFGKEKCALSIKKSEKRQITERKEMPNLERIRTLEKEITSNWEYWK